MGLLLSLLWMSLLFSSTFAEVHYHEFVIEATPVKRLCKTHNIITVNGQYPGPTLEARNGDTMIIKAINRAKYNATLHWHGIRQMRTGWADGPEFVTQCPIRPGETYTYWFTIEGQEGTLWWHAHSSWLRATVHGALIIYPRLGSPYPFAQPHREFPVIIGEWWNRDPLSVVRQATKTGAAPNISDAFTINGQPGDLFRCSSQDTTVFPVSPGETILLRFINAAMNNEHFVSIAGHIMTVVAADAAYTKPFTTPYLLLGPGQTTDVLLSTADAHPLGARFYIAAHAYSPAPGVPFDNTTTTAILEYTALEQTDTTITNTANINNNNNNNNKPLHPAIFPPLPAFNDTRAVAAFAAGIRSPGPVKLPGPVTEHLLFTVGLGLYFCPPQIRCGGPNNTRFAASMNSVSLVLPRTLSLLQAHYLNIPGVFTPDFPPFPPVQFDYTGNNISRFLQSPLKGTKLFRLKYGSVVELVLQGTNIFAGEEHPMHLHGHDFYVLATGKGNFDPRSDPAKFNLVDPPLRNTIGVPVRGWAAIRFVADNPGVWLMHCHIDTHLTWGLAMAFITENGIGEFETIEPPPADLPIC